MGRALARICLERASPRDLGAIRSGLAVSAALHKLLHDGDQLDKAPQNIAHAIAATGN